MEFSDDSGTAAKHSAAARRFMERYKVPPTPQNFMIWYAYASGQYPALKHAIDALIAENESIFADQSDEIFDRYFGYFSRNASIEEASSQIFDVAGDVLRLVSQASDNAEVFGAALAEGMGSLGKGSDAPAVADVVKLLAKNTQKMLEQNKRLQDKLENSSKEIQQLKGHLEDVQKEASTDGLTGIANRRQFDKALDHEAESAATNGDPLCLVLADIDHFKKFNDTHGHQTGDHVLKFVSAMLTRSVKARDLPARYGGEEFAVILPATDLRSAVSLADSVRVAVAGKRLRKKRTGDDIGNITLSFGVSKYRPPETLIDFIKRADDGLYRAKRLGRNRVVPESELDAAAD